ncbi:hypothetical protein AGMMS49965_25450 [Bacteroidia bacterium]|nr:hypothetical protein AGMMS49965_25450 [Bacteroidia bacterium]
MKKFIIYIVVYLLIILGAAISLEVVLQHIPNDYSYKNDYLDTHADEIETLILGSSHAYFGIDPIYFSGSTFNAAHVSQPLNYDYAILKKYDEKLVNLKTVIISFSYFNLWFQFDKNEASRIKNYILYYGIKNENVPLKFHFELLSNNLKANIGHILSYFKGTNIRQSKLGWVSAAIYLQDISNLDESGKNRAAAHTVDIHSIENQKLFTDNVAFLDSIIQICQRHNAEVLLLTTPHYKTYREQANEEQLNAMIKTANEIADKHSNCTYTAVALILNILL